MLSLAGKRPIPILRPALPRYIVVNTARHDRLEDRLKNRESEALVGLELFDVLS